MKVEFTLTYAEFIGAHETQQGEVSHSVTAAAAAVYILAALACSAFGLWAAVHSHLKPLEGSLTRATGFAGAGVLLLLGLPCLLQWRRRADQRLSEERLRKEFHQNWEGPGPFEADDQGWSYRSNNGHDVRPWQAFRGFWEVNTVLLLQSEKEMYILPKRALRGEELAELSSRVADVFQQGADGGVFTSDLRASAWDYVLGAASAQRWLYTASGLVLLGVAMAACLSLLIYQLLQRVGDEEWSNFFLPVSLMLLVLFIVAAPLASLKRYRKYVESVSLIRVSVTSEAMFLQTPKLYRILK